MKTKITTYLRYGDLKQICEMTKLSIYHINSGFSQGDPYIIKIIEEFSKNKYGNPEDILNDNKIIINTHKTSDLENDGQERVIKYREYIQILKSKYELELKGRDKKRALAAGRKYYLALSLDDTLTLKDEQAIANDLFTMN